MGSTEREDSRDRGGGEERHLVLNATKEREGKGQEDWVGQLDVLPPHRIPLLLRVPFFDPPNERLRDEEKYSPELTFTGFLPS